MSAPRILLVTNAEGVAGEGVCWKGVVACVLCVLEHWWSNIFFKGGQAFFRVVTQ